MTQAGSREAGPAKLPAAGAAASEIVNRSGMAAAHRFSMPQPLDPAILRQWAQTLTGPVIFPDDAAYDSARIVWNRAIDLRPAAVVRAAGVDDVVRTVEFACTHHVRLAVRSGGPTPARPRTGGHGIVVGLGRFSCGAPTATAPLPPPTAGARGGGGMGGTQR